MTFIDFSDEDGIDSLVSHWADRIRTMHASHIAGVEKRRYRKDEWGVWMEVYVSKDDPEYIAFMERFGR